MHQKRVTSELHDSYFRLMTIKHSISKIEWASNNYITQLSLTSQLNWVPVPVEFDAQGASGVASRVPDSWRQDVVGKPHPAEGALGNPDGVWGPEKLLIRCSRSPSRVSPRPLLSIKRTRKTQRDGHKTEGSKCFSYVRSPAPSHTQPWTTLSTPCNKVIGKYFVKKSSCVFVTASYYCVVVML